MVNNFLEFILFIYSGLEYISLYSFLVVVLGIMLYLCNLSQSIGSAFSQFKCKTLPPFTSLSLLSPFKNIMVLFPLHILVP